MVTNYRQVTDLGTAENQAYGVFKDRVSLETALEDLRQTGFPMHKVSILVRETDSPEQSSPLTNGDDRNYGTLTCGGHLLEGAMTTLTGLDRVTLPGIGLALVIGPEAEPLMQAAQSQAILNAAEVLQQFGVPEAAAQDCRSSLMAGAFLMTVQGTDEEMRRAGLILKQHGMSL